MVTKRVDRDTYRQLVRYNTWWSVHYHIPWSLTDKVNIKPIMNTSVLFFTVQNRKFFERNRLGDYLMSLVLTCCQGTHSGHTIGARCSAHVNLSPPHLLFHSLLFSALLWHHLCVSMICSKRIVSTCWQRAENDNPVIYEYMLPWLPTGFWASVMILTRTFFLGVHITF